MSLTAENAFEIMITITVKDMLILCQEAIRKGQANKKILISNDDEGNGYHEMFYGFSATEKFFNGNKRLSAPQLPFNVTPEDAIKNYIILG